jgi:hypothetical protein
MPSEAEEAGDCFGQVQSVSSNKVRKDASHLSKPHPKRIWQWQNHK